MPSPRVTSKDRKLHISYEVPDRIHSSVIYPTPAPNGSTVVLHGNDRGVQVIWRGGRRHRQKASAQQSASLQSSSGAADVIMIDDSSDEQQQPKEARDGPLYEDEEDEADTDCPFSSVVQDVVVELGSAVLHLAIPSAQECSAIPISAFLKTNVIAVAACADGRLRAIAIPLAPPTQPEQDLFSRRVAERCVSLHTKGGLLSDVAVKLQPIPDSTEQVRSRSRSRQDALEAEFLIAGVSSSLLFWKIHLTSNGLRSLEEPLVRKVPLRAQGLRVSFHPSSRSTQLLVADRTGAARIYDPFASQSSTRRPSSRDSTLSVAVPGDGLGKWIMTYHTSFQTPKADESSSPILARRKKLLDVEWAMNGRCILALLEDGEWGLRDLASPVQSGKTVEEFTLSGFIGSAAPTDPLGFGSQRRSNSRLAPMTPNTRKAKSEQLFSGPPRVSGLAPQGGIAVSSTTSRTGQTDESVMFWYNSDIYCIPSLQAFYHRSTVSGGTGSLYAPGLTHIHDVNLQGENITSINQFRQSVSSGVADLGQMNVQRDLLIGLERRVIIVQSLRPRPTASRQLFQQATAAAERPTSRDRAMLDGGALDLGGMDRMLDSMANGDDRPRRVGFAH